MGRSAQRSVRPCGVRCDHDRDGDAVIRDPKNPKKPVGVVAAKPASVPVQRHPDHADPCLRRRERAQASAAFNVGLREEMIFVSVSFDWRAVARQNARRRAGGCAGIAGWRAPP